MTRAVLNRPSRLLESCELTFIERSSIDFEKACSQHGKYAERLAALGAEVVMLDINRDCADGVFVEDLCVVLDEVCVITPLGNEKRRAEIPRMADELGRFRKLAVIEAPARLEGGDVLRVGRTLYAGLSRRTDRAGIEALTRIAAPLGYSVVPVSVSGCLHLKTCVTAIDAETFVVNRDWLDVSAFERYRVIDVDPSEPWAGNTLSVNGVTITNAAYPRTREKIEALCVRTESVDISEFGKAEAGLTCMSLIFERRL